MSQWQLIETAPRNETALLAYWPSGSYAVIRWSYDDEIWESNGTEVFRPTHWMPLPSPPSD